MAEFWGVKHRGFYQRSLLLGAGSEGEVYRVAGNRNLLMKTYKEFKPERWFVVTTLQKLLEGNSGVCGIVDILVEKPGSQDVTGIVVRKARGVSLGDWAEKRRLPLFRVMAARRLWWNTFILTNARPQVFLGDRHYDNVLVWGIWPTDIDNDSFSFSEVNDPLTGQMRQHIGMVGVPLFVAPERHKNPHLQHTQATVAFSGAVLSHYLLKGCHPCKYFGTYSNHPTEMQAMNLGCYGPWGGSPAKGWIFDDGGIPAKHIPMELNHLFQRALLLGHHCPDVRPSPQDFYEAFTRYERWLLGKWGLGSLVGAAAIAASTLYFLPQSSSAPSRKQADIPLQREKAIPFNHAVQPMKKPGQSALWQQFLQQKGQDNEQGQE